MFVGFEHPVARVPDELEFHFPTALGAVKGILVEGLRKALLKGLGRHHPIGSINVFGRHFGKQLRESFPNLLVLTVGMDSVVANSLKPLLENVLHHAADESDNGNRLVLNRFSKMIAIPVADIYAIIPFDATNGDRRGDDILGQIASEAFPARRDDPFLEISDEAIFVLAVCLVDIGSHFGLQRVPPQHGQEAILPLVMERVVWDVGLMTPSALMIDASSGLDDV